MSFAQQPGLHSRRLCSWVTHSSGQLDPAENLMGLWTISLCGITESSYWLKIPSSLHPKKCQLLSELNSPSHLAAHLCVTLTWLSLLYLVTNKTLSQVESDFGPGWVEEKYNTLHSWPQARVTLFFNHWLCMSENRPVCQTKPAQHLK